MLELVKNQLIIACIYRRLDITNTNFGIELERLQLMLEVNDGMLKTLYIAGDVNLPMLDWNQEE